MRMLRFGLGTAVLVGIAILVVFLDGKKQQYSIAARLSSQRAESPLTMGVDAAGESTSRTTATTNPSLYDVPPTMITGTTDVPLYPGAYDIKQTGGEKWNKVGGVAYLFRSNSSANDVIDFYKRELIKRGWVLALVSSPESMNFVWTNPVKEIPFRRHIDFHFNGATWFSQSEQIYRTEVFMRYERWPHPDNVPLYPNAQQVQVTERKDQDSDYKERVVTFLTKASAAEVLTYYEDVLIQHGWAWTGPPYGEEANTRIFQYSNNIYIQKNGTPVTNTYGMVRVTSSHVEVHTYSGENGMTKVELVVAGDELSECC
jgi:hypothetical protein